MLLVISETVLSTFLYFYIRVLQVYRLNFLYYIL